MGAELPAVGYAVPLVVAPGGTVALKLSGEDTGAVTATAVRFTCCDPDPASAGIRFAPVGEPVQARLRPQVTRPGSHIRIDAPPAPAGSFSVAMLVLPTRRDAGRQTLMAQWDADRRAGFILAMTAEGGLDLTLGDGAGAAQTVSIGRPLGEGWQRVGAVLSLKERRVSLVQGALNDQEDETAAQADLDAGWALPAVPLLIGAAPGPSAHLNGRIERPALLAGAADPALLRRFLTDFPLAPPESCIACWDLARDIAGIAVTDIVGGHHGRTVNLPARGVTGAFWDASSNEWWHAPERYAAIHLHDDDIADCGWETAATLAIPAAARSGYYAAKIEAADGRHLAWVPFFVSAAAQATAARIAVLAPTYTYLAYANSHIKLDHPNSEALFERVLTLTEVDLYLNAHREIGLSLYDTHTDGSGVFYSSPLRPILNIGPGPSSREYVNDSLVPAWLEHEGFDYDVITDEDLHRQGAALLGRYAVLITLSHPEYDTTRMLDAIEAFQNAGGRHMYLGGNGFYWRIGLSSHHPGVVENRRGFAGMRTWEGEPGEEGLSFTAEPGGMWRHLGRAPQRLTGVGFCASVFDRYGWYRRVATERFAFVFEGVPDPVFGRRAVRNDGTVGFEVDRWEPGLGSPRAGVVLATSEGLGPGALLSVEEMITTTRALDAEQTAQVRADMVMTPIPRGGAVWSTGSVAWVQGLPVDGFDNDVARITRNVLVRFLDPAPL